jgi:hypothetical protein
LGWFALGPASFCARSATVATLPDRVHRGSVPRYAHSERGLSASAIAVEAKLSVTAMNRLVAGRHADRYQSRQGESVA